MEKYIWWSNTVFFSFFAKLRYSLLVVDIFIYFKVKTMPIVIFWCGDFIEKTGISIGSNENSGPLHDFNDPTDCALFEMFILSLTDNSSRSRHTY